MTEKGSILVVDDEKGQREILKTILEDEGYDVTAAGSGRDALRIVQRSSFDCILTDLKMPGMDGIQLMKEILKASQWVSIVIMTAHGTISSAVGAMKHGAFDYLTKPLDRDEIIIVIKNAVDKANLLKENISLKAELRERFKLDNIIIGTNNKMRECIRIAEKVSASNSTVLIYGESGTGKELIAKGIHHNSQRRDKPFMAINCAAIPENLLESELFGYEKGAFTGAFARKIGLFEYADGGTLFLDEIGDMGTALQAKLLRTIQEREIRRLGGKENIKSDVRIVAATNKNLEEEIKKNRFREDLFYRLNVIAICLPPLRERKEDIPELAGYFIERYSMASGKEIKDISDDALNLIMNYNWPGNVRQLESIIERAVLLTDGKILDADALPMEIKNRPYQIGKIDFEIPDEGMSLEEFEKVVLLKAMIKSNWVIAKAASLLGISYRTLQYRLEKFGIKKEVR
ncbi:MAG: Fis family transcriptional regulator [Deltaproteobacteria bacterium GWC2_42_11]|nr:MAG: Fis family transcriptional regulator [Deltaproteobacteria bacterium GWC2_42_11]HBO84784.1 DNA-binding response regulator [Deltaproteobacteria bacterium]